MLGLYLIFGIFALASWLVSNSLQKRFKQYAQIPTANGMSGKEVVEKMLRDHGVSGVKVGSVSGMLTDHYNPVDKTINLSHDVYSGRNVAAAAIAAHAIANDKDYKYVYKTRSYIPFGDVIFRLDVFDKDDNRILSGPVHEKTSNEQIEIFSADYSTVIMTYYKRNLEGATDLVKDLTKEYQATYPTVTKVELFIQTLLIQ